MITMMYGITKSGQFGLRKKVWCEEPMAEEAIIMSLDDALVYTLPWFGREGLYFRLPVVQKLSIGSKRAYIVPEVHICVHHIRKPIFPLEGHILSRYKDSIYLRRKKGWTTRLGQFPSRLPSEFFPYEVFVINEAVHMGLYSERIQNEKE